MNLTAQKSSKRKGLPSKLQGALRKTISGPWIRDSELQECLTLNNRMQTRLEVHARRRVHLLRRAQRLVRVGAAAARVPVVAVAAGAPSAPGVPPRVSGSPRAPAGLTRLHAAAFDVPAAAAEDQA